MSIVGVELDTPEVSSEAESNFRPNMVVVGIGGGGGNAVNNMISQNLEGVDFIEIGRTPTSVVFRRKSCTTASTPMSMPWQRPTT